MEGRRNEEGRKWVNTLRWKEEGMRREGIWVNTVKIQGRRNEQGRKMGKYC